MKAAVLGTSGYTGQLLIRFLLEHPDVTEIVPVSSSQAGEKLAGMDPGLGSSGLEKVKTTGQTCVTIEQAKTMKPDVVFAALPHQKSGEVCGQFLETSVIIDLSADFRFRDAAVFTKAYGAAPPRPDLLDRAVFGLCEWHTAAIKHADLIANPGCYVTSALLPLLPLVKEKLIKEKIIVNSFSGISGAGKKTEVKYLYCERTENAGAYSPGTQHRHCAEIQAELDGAVKGSQVFFLPHLAPMKRGIASTIAMELKKAMHRDEIIALYKKYYGGKPFVGIREKGQPETGDVWGSNRCDIGFHIEGENLFLFSVLDNLVKGASGQAIQNMNLRFGLGETAGLRRHGEF
jgi:N-acetyl-gamma-glutamyl-phosphate reductase